MTRQEQLAQEAQERSLLLRFLSARDRFIESESLVDASTALRVATALVEISDDYQAQLDEADDMMAEAWGLPQAGE